VPVQVSVEEVNEAFRTASLSGPLSAILDYTEEPIVSSDVLGNPASCLFDAGLTLALAIGENQTLIKANGWYDNEWGYANRLVDLVLLVAKKR
jgi:glyceraldehyde 3-phosphate dehydrogenase